MAEVCEDVGKCLRKVTWDSGRGLCSMKKVQPCMVL